MPVGFVDEMTSQQILVQRRTWPELAIYQGSQLLFGKKDVFPSICRNQNLSRRLPAQSHETERQQSVTTLHSDEMGHLANTSIQRRLYQQLAQTDCFLLDTFA